MMHSSGLSLRTLSAWAFILGAGAASIVNLHPGYHPARWPKCTVLPAAHAHTPGVEEFIAAHADLLRPLLAAIERGEAIAPTQAQRAAMDELDAIAHQRDALWSRLQWHTDLDSALAEAKTRGVPVLSLRMLGRLDESLSCTNSRYFRAALYPNQEVSQYLRDHFVLHWHTVREAPVLTVDFGDGRTLRQTITGNSIHYVISPKGEVVDALPGLYTPGMFLEELSKAARSAPVAESALRAAVISASIEPARFARADEAGARATSKMALEFPTLRSLTPVDASLTPHSMLVAGSVREPGLAPVFDARSRSLALSQLAGTGLTPEQIERTLATFEAAARTDSTRNQTDLRPQVLALLGDPSLRGAPEELDRSVYDTVFLSPLADEWAGLVDPDAFAGLWARDRFAAAPGG